MSTPSSSSTPIAARVAIVTGGTRGIGLGISRGLLRDGLAVAVVYQRDEAAAASARAELEKLGGRVLVVKADVSTRAGAEQVVARVVETWGRL
ncbi:MAG TPA: SDR family NAD(P)-dependent oxidoreductase, partial [Anaeromyxobacter sp.]|nr:SDR family NAD(P)-dependent oxidoreductase [Anaeromyxobacter sp.]